MQERQRRMAGDDVRDASAVRRAVHALVFALVLGACMVSGCATSGRADKTFSGGGTPKTIYVSERQSDTEARHINQVLRVFEKHGFDVMKDKTQANYYLDFSITGGWTVTVEIALYRTSDRKSVLRVSSTNSGWGTVIARPIAVAGRVAEALDELDDVLARSR